MRLPTLILLVSGCLQAWASSAPGIAGYTLDRLASPAMEGRRTGTPGGQRASAFVDSLFRASGLQAPPFGDTADGTRADTHLQPFRWVPPEFVGGGMLEFRLPSGPLPVIQDSSRYAIPSWSGGGQGSGEVLFAGYGLINREIPRWDDYAHLDLRGKVVVLQSGLPAGVEPDTGNSLPARAALAARLGAEAVLFSPDAFGALDLRESAGGELAFEPVAVPVMFLSLDLSDSLLMEEGYTTRSFVARMNRARKSVSLTPANQRVRVTTPAPAAPSAGTSVLGWLPGRSEEFIVISAHFDHLGLVDTSRPAVAGNVYTGADDNASGVAALLEVANRLAQRPVQDRPLSVLFVAFDAEEQGRVGSRWFCSHLGVTGERIRLVLNLDMVGRLEGRPLQIFDAGRADGLVPLLEAAAPDHGLDLALADLAASPGDHSSFLEHGIPAVMFFSGTHADYNTPDDTADRIDHKGLTRIIGFLVDVVDRVAERENGFVLSGDPTPKSSGAARVTVAMGIVPGYAGGGEGMEVSAVRDGSPAGLAGLKAGDRITALGRFPVTSIYDYTFALRHFHAGDTVDVTLLRDGNRQQVAVQLAERQAP